MSMLSPREVPPAQWRQTAVALRDGGRDHLVYLDAHDELGRADEIVVALRVVGPGLEPVDVRTRVPRDGGELPSLADVWPAAGWSERAVAEAYLVAFAGNPDPRGIHVRPDSGLPRGHLRKEHLLAARQETPWPGAADEGGRARRRHAAPGVADPAAASDADRVASAYGGRRR